MKILLVGHDQSTRTMIEAVLTKNSSAHEFSVFSNLGEAKPLLSSGDVDLVVVNLTPENIEESRKILKSLAKSLLLVKALFLLPDEEVAKHEDFDLIQNFFQVADHVNHPVTLIKLSSKMMDLLTGVRLLEETNILFWPVKIDLLKNLHSVSCDIFVKISETKYVKIINKGQENTIADTVERYQKKGIEMLYVEKQYYPSFSQMLMQELFTAEVKSLPASERGIKITESIINVTKDLGASEVVIESINESYTEVIKNLENEKVSNLLASLSTDENIFIENHSYLTSVFAVMLSRKMDWSNAKIQNNLCMAALLHDLVLADHKLGQYDRDDLETIKKLPKETRDIVINHPKMLADKLSKTTKIPSDVISLISKHHEGRGKNSYPGAENTVQLTPVNCLFNVAHQFSIELYKIGFNNQKLPTAFANLREMYQASNMRTYIDLLEKNVSL